MIKKALFITLILSVVSCAKGPIRHVKQKNFAGSVGKNFTKKNVGLSDISGDSKSLFWGTEKGDVIRVTLDQKQKWRSKLKDTITTQVLIQEPNVFVGTQKGSIFCLDYETGKIQWEHNYKTSIRGPLLSFHEHIFFLGLDGQVIGVTSDSGEMGFQQKFFMNESFTLAHELGGTALEDQMIFLLPNLEAFAINTDLEIKWKKSLQAQSGNDLLQGFVSVDAIDQGLLVTPYMHTPFVLDSLGEIKMSLTDIRTSAAPVVGKKEITFVGSNHIHRLDRKNLSVLSVDDYRTSFPVGGVVEKGNLLFIALSNGALDVYHREQKEKIWTYHTGSPLKGEPLDLDGTLWLLNQRSQLFAFKPPFRGASKAMIKP